MEYYLKKLGKDDSRRPIEHIDFLINNKYISDNKIIEHTFNNYVTNVGSSLARNTQTEINPLLYFDRLDQCLHIPEINTYEIRTIISNIPNFRL